MKWKLKKAIEIVIAMGLCMNFMGCSAEQMEEFGSNAGEELRKWADDAGEMLQELKTMEPPIEPPHEPTEPPTELSVKPSKPPTEPTESLIKPMKLSTQSMGSTLKPAKPPVKSTETTEFATKLPRKSAESAMQLPDSTDLSSEDVIVTEPITYFALSQLNKREGKLYNAIYKAAMQYEHTTTVYDIYNMDEIRKVLNAVCADHPELFWLEGDFEYSTETMSDNKKTTITLDGYNDWSELLLCKRTQEIEAIVLHILGMAMTYETDYERALFVHDYLVDMTTYSFDSDECYSLYGCLADRFCVCAGYAKAYQYLLQRLGIPCGYTVGVADGENHAWNFVELDGAYYWVDVTWDDPISETPELLHSYCFVTTEMLERTHIIGEEENLFIPVCDTMEYNFYVQEESYFTAYDDEVKAAIAAGKRELCFSNAAAYEEMITDLIEENHIWDYLPVDRYSYTSDDEQCVLKLDYT